MSKKIRQNLSIRSSAAEYLTFIAASGDAVIRNSRITAVDGKGYSTKHYNLSAIIAEYSNKEVA